MTTTQPDHHYKLHYPRDLTEQSMAFWSSKHVDNRAKAIISFSRDEEDAIKNLQRWCGTHTQLANTTYSARKSIWLAFSEFVDMPEMLTIPYSELGVNMEHESPYPPTYPPNRS
jgi:hypothetical protein